MTRLDLTREQILAFRRGTGALDKRLPFAPESLRQAAWAGLQDSMPRAAGLSIHARVDGTQPDTWDDHSLVQIWGPRFSVYVVALKDLAVFTLGRTPDSPSARQRAEDLAGRLAEHLGEETMTYREAGLALGEHPNRLRYATTTGTVVIRWEGSGKPTIRSVRPPDVEPREARLELARRHLHVFGPATAEWFGHWAGVKTKTALATFDALGGSLTPVRTSIGQGWILDEDEEAFRSPPPAPAAVRLLPSGDTYFLLKGTQRELLVPDASMRGLLWTPRVWPGAVLIQGEVAGTWRRAGNRFTIDTWGPIDRPTRNAIEEEAASLPLTELNNGCRISWEN